MKQTTWKILVVAVCLGRLVGANAVAEPAEPAETQAGAELLVSENTNGEQTEVFSTANLDGAALYQSDQAAYWDGQEFSESPTSPSCAVCGAGNTPPPGFYTNQSVRIIARSGLRLKSVTNEFVTFGADSGFVPLMNTAQLMPGIAAGYEGTIGRYLGRDTENRDHFVEFTYFGMNEWTASKPVTGARIVDDSGVVVPGSISFGTLFSLFPSEVRGFNRADLHTMEYRCELQNFELNARIAPRGKADRLVLHPGGKWRRECNPGDYLSYLFGLRYLSLDEDFAFRSRGELVETGGGGTRVIPLSGDYLIRTHNDLVGFQIGADYSFRRCKWTWGIRSKVGPFVNLSDQISDVTTDAAGDPFASGSDMDRHTRDISDDLAIIGDLGITATYKLRPNCLVRVSYDLLFVAGVALAPDQLDFNLSAPQTDDINRNGTVFAQGVSLGMEWLF